MILKKILTGVRVMSYREADKKRVDKYEGCKLQYKIADIECFRESNEKNYEIMKEALEAVGIYLNVKDDFVYLRINREYVEKTTRKAGAYKKFAHKDDSTIYTYSDIVHMIQTMKDQDIADKIGMPIATYRRHKKEMKDSIYYKSLDLNRLRDKEYLDSVPGNHSF